MSLPELRRICVDRFSSSTRRPLLFAELERLTSDLTSLGIICELWIDGSFLTEKDEPDDIDLSFSAWATDLDKVDPAIVAEIFRLLNGGKIYSPVLDTYICVRFLKEDPRHLADKTLYWTEKWGKGWDDWLKGYAVLRLGENDVGFRLVA